MSMVFSEQQCTIDKHSNHRQPAHVSIKMCQAQSTTYILPKNNQQLCELITAMEVYLIHVYGVWSKTIHHR
jgi:hypothetical protein